MNYAKNFESSSDVYMNTFVACANIYVVMLKMLKLTAK